MKNLLKFGIWSAAMFAGGYSVSHFGKPEQEGQYLIQDNFISRNGKHARPITYVDDVIRVGTLSDQVGDIMKYEQTADVRKAVEYWILQDLHPD